METPEKPSKETLEKWHKDPDIWRCGIFYYNKQDKRLLPPKRQECMGWTVNFANTKSVLFFVGMMAFFIFVTLFIVLKKS
ncbi:hypothetical protein H8R23_08310 [Flavobacterium sp. F-380]|uniref:DUF5808 domain-containing protein n=1 Tax=Flavobacterium kayseriense TaxID=2764714 RepID=A0ABR7J799_9FLAO|nr:hypothetical protein [Flavobacterium kayseriense]MBC5841406.1 hypothetical protein [Flavobacterium kayseriense]MBC5847934.1 hypothetical protein [Flavobacterium kayseriense]MBU0940757.1 hypothetical protein [Bacteroidota bacterium]